MKHISKVLKYSQEPFRTIIFCGEKHKNFITPKMTLIVDVAYVTIIRRLVDGSPLLDKMSSPSSWISLAAKMW